MTPRGSARSHDLLLAAATELFAERGYDRTTVRELGERAGVDPALIARHFGSKAGLYLAALTTELGQQMPTDLLERDRRGALLERLSRRGAGPVFQAALRAHEDPEVQDAARRELHGRLVAPLRTRFEHEGLDRAQLRAELATAAFAGIVLGRGSGVFDALTNASAEDIEELSGALLDGLRSPRAAGS